VASRVPVPSYVVPTDRFPPRRHEFEQRFVESRQTTGRRGLPVGEFETRQISVPTRLPTRCERLVVAPVPVNGHGSNLVGVPGRCPGSNDVEIRRVICSTNAIESFFIEEGPLDCAQLFHQTSAKPTTENSSSPSSTRPDTRSLRGAHRLQERLCTATVHRPVEICEQQPGEFQPRLVDDMSPLGRRPIGT
jgi:hypothetical protein